MSTNRPNFIIEKRNKLLLESDWSQLPDAPLTSEQKAAWVIYRQSLRDIPTQEHFPRVITWPVKPN